MNLSRPLRLALLLAAFAVAASAGTSLSSLNPPYIQAGGPNVTLSIAGSGFVPGGIVNLGYISLATTYINSTQISAVVPASFSALAGDWEIWVVNPDGSTSSFLYFYIQPVLTSVTPNSAPAGSPTTPVTITGIGFTAEFDGAFVFATASATAPMQANFVSSTRMTADIDSSLLTVPGAATIQVYDPDYPVSPTLPFTITSGPAGKPTLTSLYPSSVAAGGPPGSPFVDILISGSNFAYGCIVQWNGIALSTTSLYTAGQLSAQIPASLIALPGSGAITVVNPGTAASNALTFTVTGAPTAPMGSISPTSAVAGGPAFTLTVNGGGFLDPIIAGAVVQWSGSPLATTFVNSAQLTAQVPASLIASPGSANVTIVNPGASPSSPAVFTISSGSPVLTSFSPSSTTAGSAAFTLTISGSNFTSGATVQWNGTPLATNFISPTQLTAQVSANLLLASGAVPVTVVEPNLPASNVLTFNINPAPSVTLASISPTSISAGAQSFTLTANGTGFVTGSAIEWNGSPLITNFVSSTQLTAQIVAGLVAVGGGTASVRIANPSSVFSNSITFMIAISLPPTLSSLSPTSVASGSSAINLTVNGSGFIPGSLVQWNGAAVSTTFVSATQLTALLPAQLAPVTGSITVVNPGSVPSNALTFTVTAPGAPAIFTIAPATVTAGGPAFTLTVTGSNFIAGSIVTWSGASLPTTFLSSTQLTAQLAAYRIATPGSVSVSVFNPTGANNAAPVTFTIIAAASPAPTSLSPASIVAGSAGFTLTINGSGFVSGATAQWNGSPLATAFIGATQLTAMVPAHDIAAVDSADISVFNPGSFASNALTFTVLAIPPTLGSLSPSAVTAGSPAFSLTVNGSGFVSGATVQWNGSSLATTFVGTTLLTAQVPAADIAAVGSPNITVLNPGSAASNAVTFTVSATSIAQPVIQGVLNAASYTNALAPGTWAAIFGTQLAVSTASAQNVPLPLTLAEVKSVTVGGVPAPLSYVSPGQINFVVPFEAALGPAIPVVVTDSDGASASANITLVRNAPALFAQNAQGTGMAIALNANFQPITSVGSDVIILYAVGLGPTNPPPASSAQGGASTEPFNSVVDQVQVFIGDMPCQVQFAGLAPGFPGIYQLNIIPPAAPASNPLYITENGVTSNVTTLPIPGGTNVTNVQGSIDGLYPASGVYAVQDGNKPTTGPVSVSEMLNAGAATVSFDIRPNAQPFTVVAVGPGATAFLQIDPAGGTWQGYVTSPTPAARLGNFSPYGTVYNLLTGTPFPGNIIPLSSFDPIDAQAASLLPEPNVFPTTPSPNATFVYASQPLMQSGHFSIGSGQASDDLSNLYFGAFVNIGEPPPSTQTAQFLLFVDGVLVATKNVSYQVQ